ncbi:E3 UFM1-protein ligase 1 homolog isoform X2 [Cryptomeria japonica]|uniref:E3 UFM1-protein ligase 1 homolog isoform X2 n=1 Tax=Cryptomeria japonica TaxID=3369 RepID=UPI0027DA444E|nr:E3 UFM1-protein ligase 1 homolog isoform X2 [Cryptomeria japonica]
MDIELLELQKQFEAAQQEKSSVRLSERNVVELVNKLQLLDLLDSDLLHTVSGKEYITQDQLRTELEAEIQKLGRVSLIELADIIGVDLYHIERQAESIVANNEELMLVQGEVLSLKYWDSVAEEINERLQESSQISLAELAAQLHVGSELLTSILQPRIGTIVQGKLEGGRLYTPAYVARIRAMIRGAVRGIMVPTNLSSVWSSINNLLQQMDGGGSSTSSTEGILFQTLLNGLIKDGEVLGSLRSGVSWTPAVFAHAQRESVESFFSQNSFIGYDVLHKLAIPQPKQYLQSKYPEGIPLETVFVHPSMIGMLDAAAEDAIDNGGWFDCLSILPASFGTQDAAKLLGLCPSVQKALKDTVATVLADTCVVSSEFVKVLFVQLENHAEHFIRDKMVSTQKVYRSQTSNSDGIKTGSDASQLSKVDFNNGNSPVFDEKIADKETKKKKGKGGSVTKSPIVDNVDENQDSKGSKVKKRQSKKGDSKLAAGGAKSNHNKGSEKVVSEEIDLPSEEWILERFLDWHPDLEGTGAGQEDTNTLARSLVMHLRPMLTASWKARKQAIMAANSEKRRHVLDKLQLYLDEAYINFQLFEKALDLFEDDPSTSVILHRHLLRTTATEMVDRILSTLDFDMKLQNGDAEDALQNIELHSLNPGERISLAKGFLGFLSTRALEMVEALEGKRVESFSTALGLLAKESGLWLKRLDKKIERTVLHSYRKALASQIEAESDPVALLPKVVALLYVQVYNKALQIPGRIMAVAVSRLKERVPDMVYTTVMEYQLATVTLLALLSAGSYSLTTLLLELTTNH